MPAEGLAQGVSRRARQHRDRQEACADDADGEDREASLPAMGCKASAAWDEVWMVGDPVGVQGRGRRSG